MTGWSTQRIAMTWLLGGLATLVLMASFTAVVLYDHGWLGYYRLVNDGATANGIVVRTDHDNHCRTEYTFMVEGHEYGGFGPDCSFRVGDTVVVTYLLGHPEHSCLGLARNQLNNEISTFLVGAVLLPPFAMYAWRRRSKALEGQAAQP